MSFLLLLENSRYFNHVSSADKIACKKKFLWVVCATVLFLFLFAINKYYTFICFEALILVKSIHPNPLPCSYYQILLKLLF